MILFLINGYKVKVFKLTAYKTCRQYVLIMEGIMQRFTITKKIAKHGRQAIIVVPKILEEYLPPQTVVKLQIEVVKNAKAHD